jgi:hypothetical protein
VVVSPLLPETQRVLTPATLKTIEILDARDPSVALAVYEGDARLSRLRTLNTNTRPETPALDFNETRLVLLHLAFDPGVGVPHRLVHRVAVLAAANGGDPTPALLSYTVAPVRVGPRLTGQTRSAARSRSGRGGCDRH